MAKLLITGASGLLGSNLLLHTLEDHHVVAVTHKHPISHPRITHESADLSIPGVASKVIENNRPDWIVHCAAATNVDWCEQEPSEAMRFNRDMAGWVAEGAARANSRLIHISTDAVFDGEKGGYKEEDPPSPINSYGKSKLEAERTVLENNPSSLVLRTNIFGWNAQAKMGLAEWFISKMRVGESCIGFTDVMISPLYVTDLADIVLELLASNLSGILHAPGRDCISKYMISQRLAEVFGLDGTVVNPGCVKDLSLPAPRPKRLCLDGNKLMHVSGLVLPDMGSSLRRFEKHEADGHRERLKDLISRAIQ